MLSKFVLTLSILSASVGVTQGVYVANPVPMLQVRRCGYLAYKIPANTFTDIVDGDTRNLKLSLQNSTGGEIKSNDWIAFTPENQTLTAVLTDQRFKTLKVPHNFYYRLHATTKRGETSFATIQLVLSEEWQNTTVAFLVNFLWITEYKPPLAVILRIFADSFSDYIDERVDLLRFTHVMQDDNGYSIGVTNCSVLKDRCDHEGIKQIKKELYTEHGTVPAFRNAMLPHIYISYIQLSLSSVCKPPERPKVRKPYPIITLAPCQTIYHSIPYDIFYDEVDGYNLQLDIISIDGKAPVEADRWLSINGGESILYGLVTDRAIREEPPNGYNVTVRAYDSHFLWAETFMIVNIAKKALQRYYQFTLHLSFIGNSILSPLIEQHGIVRIINTYFKSNFTNMISYKLLGNKQFTMRSSICTLPLKCDNASFTSIWKQMVTPGSTPKTEFSRSFSARYNLRAVTGFIDPICLQAQDPPVPSINPWIVPITRCGGFKIKIPADLFYDKQDGNTQSLHLELLTSDGKEIPTKSWLQLNSTSQILFGLPTHEDIEAYNSASQQYYKLVATDRGGLNGSLQLRFSIQPVPHSTYTYQIVYKQSKFTYYLQEVTELRKKLRNYLGYVEHSSIGFEKYVQLDSNTRRIYYRNCSTLFDPCTAQGVEQVNSRLFKSAFPTSEFKNAMLPDFTVILASVENTSDCHANTPPRGLSPIPTIRVSVCGILTYILPEKTFYDKEDGFTRKLLVELTERSNKSLSKDAWLHWNTETQIITFAATVFLAETKGRQTFLLTAVDRQGLKTTMNVFTSISGPLHVLKECQIRTKFEIEQSFTQYHDVFLVQQIVSSMASYFGFTSTSKIGLVSVSRESAAVITISWSYCSAKYTHYTQASIQHHSITNVADVQGLSMILQKVFVPGTFHIHPNFKSAFRGFSILSVVKIFTGSCSSFPPIVGLNETNIIFNVSDCGYTKILVARNWFYDVEDGDAHNLKLVFLNEHRAEITDMESWINFDQVSKTILVSITDKQRKLGVSTSKFYMKATDSSGLSAELTLKINILKTAPSGSHFEVGFYFINKVKVNYLNDSMFLADRIADAYSLSTGKSVLIKSFHEDNGLIDSSLLRWSTCNQNTCSSSVLKRAKEQQGSDALFNSLKSHFSPQFQLQRATLFYMCDAPNIPPTAEVATIQMQVTMCGVSVLKLAPGLFADTTDGHTRNIQLDLLDNTKSPVTASSWIQLNAATLQLYAIPSLDSKLHQENSKFYLRGTDSQNLSTNVAVVVAVSEKPYTNDCPITIVVKRKYGTAHAVDLSVLHRLLQAISDYYNDNDIKIKVLNFKKLSTYSYSVKYSNCSFAFATKEEARKGYDESFRNTINTALFRMVSPDGSVQAAFSTFLSKMFDIVSIRISYECIEEPPYPTISKVHRSYAQTCREFRDMHSKNMFNDQRDGTNLKYSITYTSGRPISPNDWITFDPELVEVHGMVTEEVKRNAPFIGYTYLIVATDSSGRSANITYIIKIATPLPYMPITFTVAFESSFNETTPTGSVLVSMSRKIARYLDGGSRGNNIMITSYNAGKSIIFGHCKLACTQSEYARVASKFQSSIYSPEPAASFVSASQGSFNPKAIFIDGPTCLPSSSISIITQHVVVIDWPSICGFVDFKIPENTFRDSTGRTTKDFILSMYQYGRRLSTSGSSYLFYVAYQSFYGPLVASTALERSIYDLRAKHPISGLAGSTSLTLNIPDYKKFKSTSKTLCVITIAFTTAYNPAYSDAQIIRKLMTKVASYLQLTIQELQIVSYSREQQYPVKMFVSFANCHWYTWLSTASNPDVMAKYMSSRSYTMRKVFANFQEKFTTNSSFYEALKPDFHLTSGFANKWCTNLPNIPPTVNITVIKIVVKPCVGFFQQIPENAFKDEDGNARSLTLQMYHKDGSPLTFSDWISFNTATQVLYGTPTKSAQSTNGGIHEYVLKATDKYGLSANSTVSIEISGSAPGNEKPKILINDYKITLPKWGTYRATLPDDFAKDKEDGSMRHLNVEIRMADGSSLPRDSLIQFDKKTYEIYSLAAERANGGAELHYKVIVTDSCGGTAETTIRVGTQASQAAYYSHVFKFASLMGSSVTNLDIQLTFLKLISAFFGGVSSNYKTTAFIKQNSSEFYEFRFSNYSTNEYVCPKTNNHYITQQNIFKESTTNMNSFSAFVAQSFRITSYQNSTSYNIDQPPSNASIVTTDIKVTDACKDNSLDISKGYFVDSEPKSSLTYSLTLKNGAEIPSHYPLQLTSSKLQVVPFGFASSGVYEVRITAFDRCNQSTYRNIKVTINTPNRPAGYQVTVEAKVNTQFSSIFYFSQFKQALQNHLGNSNYGITIESYSRGGNDLRMKWSSCYETLQKCNKSDIAYLHSRLFTTTNVTDRRFIMRLEGIFNNTRLTDNDKNCNFTSHEPPISNGSIEITVDLCRKFEFRIPVYAFNDKEDGNTRSLHLSLLMPGNLQIPYTHWLQFDRPSQMAYGYPRYVSKASFQSRYNYILVAKDVEGHQTSSRFTASIRGSTEITYKLTMYGRIRVDHHRPNVDCEIILMRKIGDFFGDQFINDISFTRQGDSFEFSWSFCKMQTQKCDCFYIKHVESFLARMEEFRQTMSPEFILYNVTTVRYGVCIHPSAPQVLVDKRDIYVNGGKSFSYYVNDRHFYDLEDGYTKNLTLYIADNSNKVVSSSYWLQVNQQYICGLALLSELRNSEWRSTNKEHKLVARDACGKEASDSFSVIMSTYRTRLNYRMNVYVANSYASVRGNCTKMQRFEYLVSSYLKINSSDVLIDNIYVYQWLNNRTSSVSNYTVVVWGIRNFTEKNCSNDTVRSFRGSFVYENGSTNYAFYQYMKSDFDVIRVDDDNSSCANGSAVPIIGIVKPSDFDFPLWILILLLILAILFLLCWFCWVCIPRCCAGCCAGCIDKYCGCCGTLCGKCCIPGGKYASLDEAALAPDVEKGVLSDARTAPDVDEEKFGTEAIPDEDDSGVLANAGSEPDSVPSKIDEDVMKLDQDAVPMLYSAPDYLVMKEPVNDHNDDEYGDASPNHEAEPTEAGAAPMPNDSSGGVAPMAHEESIPNDTSSGVASMPHEEHQEMDEFRESHSETFASESAPKDYINEDSLSVGDWKGGQPSSQSESSYSRYTESEALEMPAALPLVQESMAPTRTKRLSLPQMPNVFSAQSAQRPTNENFNMLGNHTSSSEGYSSANARNVSEGRRVSVTRPLKLILPRESISSMGGDTSLQHNNNVMSSSNRRRSSQMLLLDNDAFDDDNYNHQGRRESQIFIRNSDNNGLSKRVSVVRLNSADGSYVDDDHIRLKMADDASVQNLPPWQKRAQEARSLSRVSVVSNGFSSGGLGYSKDDSDADRNRRASIASDRRRQSVESEFSPQRRTSKARRMSLASARASGDLHPANYSDFDQGGMNNTRRVSVTKRRMSSTQPKTARRISTAARRESSADRPFTSFFSENDQDGYDYSNAITSKNSTSQLLGYGSDSTDSGYAITRQSKRYRRKSRDLPNGRNAGIQTGDDGYGKERVQIRRKSVTTVANGDTEGRRSSRGHKLSRDYEMWSHDRNGSRNVGYESDSYV